MGYPIETYRAQAAIAFGKLLQMLPASGNGWQIGNVFDTLLDYVLRNPTSEPRPNALAEAALERWKATQSSMCWYDDYAWWGIASSKAFDDRYAEVFGPYRATFQDISIGCWKLMHLGKPAAGPYKYLGAPAVWQNRDEGDEPGYFTSRAGWAAPRFPNGVWQYDMWVGTRTDPPDCTPNQDASGGRVSDPTSRYCPLGPYQNTVVNTLFLELALRLALHGQGDEFLAAANAELGFLHSWFQLGDHGPLQAFDDGSALICERVPTYADYQGTEMPVEGFAADSMWTGDQGLLIGGLVDKLRALPTDPQNASDQALALAVTTGVLVHLATPKGVPSTSDGFNQGDEGDYCCGSGVFWRYLLYGFGQNPKVKQVVLDLVAADPDGNAVFVSAQNATTAACAGANSMFDQFNALATLVAAIEILGQHDDALTRRR
ncbi:MAG TPA: hypothetical protein VJ850_08390 [Candidatus Limnocylindrales bacterium]|nr:hypothetical protein [Candidatus Limnocylindrales bacterium]